MRKQRLALAAAGLGTVMMLSACGGDTDLTEDADDEDGADAAAEDLDELEIGLIAWDEAIATTHMWQVLLEEKGYDVTVTDLDVAPTFQGLANGDIDLFLDVWLPDTHADYWEDFGDDVEDITTWYDNAILTLTVPEYVDEVDSIEDLADNADLFDGEIIGIESGSGLYRTVEEEVIPDYGLEDDYEHLDSSSAAMQAELDAAIAEEEPILVTLWRPHISYSQHDLKDLEDPEGSLGDGESLHVAGRDGFSEDYPQLTSWLEQYELDDAELDQLTGLVNDEYEDDPAEGARIWLSENPEFVERTLGDDAEGLEF
jgi:glycine betaine/proline transport system substrate-binding protein